VFSQGDRADAIYFLQTCRVKVSVVSSEGKEAVLSLLGPQLLRRRSPGWSVSPDCTVTTLEPITMLRVERRHGCRALMTGSIFP
jgi:hypothetical protein